MWKAEIWTNSGNFDGYRVLRRNGRGDYEVAAAFGSPKGCYADSNERLSLCAQAQAIANELNGGYVSDERGVVVAEFEPGNLEAWRTAVEKHLFVFQIRTILNHRAVVVRCDEPTARILLPMWATAEPNETSCQNVRTGQWIACFLDDDETPEPSDAEDTPPCDPLYGQRMDSADMGEN